MSLHSEKAIPVQPEPQVTAENNAFVCRPSPSVPVNPEKRHTSPMKIFISKSSATFK